MDLNNMEKGKGRDESNGNLIPFQPNRNHKDWNGNSLIIILHTISKTNYLQRPVRKSYCWKADRKSHTLISENINNILAYICKLFSYYYCHTINNIIGQAFGQGKQHLQFDTIRITQKVNFNLMFRIRPTYRNYSVAGIDEKKTIHLIVKNIICHDDIRAIKIT